jgi:hypothetical protein
MVTTGGHRNPVAREDAYSELATRGVSSPDAVLDALLARRLLTAERRGGIQRLEITHDVLAPLVVNARNERRGRQANEEAERERKEARARADVERRRRKRLRLTLGGVSLLLAFALGALGYALVQKRRADEATTQLQETLAAQRKTLQLAQVENWLWEYQRAWNEKEVGKLRTMLHLDSTNAERLADALVHMIDLHVRLDSISIVRNSDTQLTASFTRVDQLSGQSFQTYVSVTFQFSTEGLTATIANRE